MTASGDVGSGVGTEGRLRLAASVHQVGQVGVRLMIAVGVIGLMLAGRPGPGRAQVPDSTLWCLAPGANVLACARTGNTLYVGGNFGSIWPCTGGGVPVGAATGAPLARYPRVAGYVDAALPDGAGGWYLGGKFVGVGGCPRRNLAHIRPDGTVDDWVPDPDGEVRCIARQGRTLYVGGDFDSISGVPRSRVAALRSDTGQPLDWNPQANGRVNAMVISCGRVFVGGDFTSIGGTAQLFAAALDPATGTLESWDPGVDGEVLCIAVCDTTVLLGGYFASVGGTSHACIAKVGMTSATTLAWDPVIVRLPVATFDGGPHVSAMLLKERSIFVAGSFTSIGGVARGGLAAIDAETAAVSPWDPRARFSQVLGASFWALATSGSSVFVAGTFDSIAGVAAHRVAALDIATAEMSAWNPRPNDYVMSLAAAEDVVFLGGRFNSLGEGATRLYLAALDTRTGRPTDWNPQLDDYVTALTTHNGIVYAAGFFGSVNGQPRAGLAAIDSATGNVMAWDPRPDGGVSAIAPVGGRVFLGGRFTHVGGLSRRYAAAVDTAAGALLPWDPSADWTVNVLLPTDSVVYAGGWFSNIGGQPRASLAALDPTTGEATPWDPGTDGVVMSMAAGPSEIFIGGIFDAVHGAPRSNIAAVDLLGSPTPWTADADERVLGMVLHDSTLYTGGFFASIGGQPRACLAALDIETGLVRPWRLDADINVWTLAGYEDQLYVGGNFTWIGSTPQDGIAAVSLSGVQAPDTVGTRLVAQLRPNPSAGACKLWYVLPAAAQVTLKVFDLQGRQVRSSLVEAMQPPGPHSVDIDGRGLRPGCYLCWLSTGRQSATSKMIVVK